MALAQDPRWGDTPETKCLIGIGVVQRRAVQRLWRVIEMRPEIRGRRRHFRRTPNVAEAEHGVSARTPLLGHVVRSRTAAGSLFNAVHVCSLLRFDLVGH